MLTGNGCVLLASTKYQGNNWKVLKTTVHYCSSIGMRYKNRKANELR